MNNEQLKAQNQHLKKTLRKIYERLNVDETNYKIRDGGPLFAVHLIAKQALVELKENLES